MSSEEGNYDGLHIVMFPFFAFGHISPFVQLSNKLSSQGVQISFFTPSGLVNRINTMLNSTTTTTQIIPLTLPYVDGLPPGIESTDMASAEGAELLKIALDLMQPQVQTLLSDLKPNLVVFDFAQHWLPKMASELGIKSINYSVLSPVAIAYLIVRLHPNPTLDEVKILPPGYPSSSHVTSLKTYEAQSMLYAFKSFNGRPSAIDSKLTGINGCDAILFKTCMEIEGPYIDSIKSRFPTKPVLLAGPLVPEPGSLVGEQIDDTLANWLTRFPPKSVIYCSFGSETFLTDDQIEQLALGLELTGLPFFLVLNFPASVSGATEELRRALPEGFLERVKDKGVVRTGWVPQQRILAHDSVGCYVCHAGMSSIMEGLVNDCQLVMLPMKVDQFFNCKLVGLDWKAGVEVNRRDEDGYFGKEDVSEAVRRVMVEVGKEPGKSIRANHRKWREFLQNDDIQDKLIKDLILDFNALVYQNTT